MRKANQEIKDPEIIEQILAGAEICRIAMIDGDVPYMLPFNYGYRDRCIYVHSQFWSISTNHPLVPFHQQA